MSTLSGLASKGEKPKVKFQCLDINSLYRVSRGESLEKQQQKSTLIKHGMQSLGKVPNARRAPKNLPSMKLEYSGTDTAIALVPQGGSGWGKQETTSTSTVSTTTSTTTTSSSTQGTNQLSSHQAAIALPVTTTIPPQNKHAMPVGTDKSWSAITSGSDPLHPPPYQSPQFQHEFPSLFSGEGGGTPARTNAETTYTPGLSLRPQTEGSWIQGGSRLGGDGVQRNTNLAPLGAPPQLSAPVGLPQDQQPFPAQFRGVMPPFMYKGNFASNSSGGTQSPNISSVNGRSRPPENRPMPPRLATDGEEVTHRPIIKEEDLSRMDEISRDMGWASHEDIDYNQKLSFSDDESVGEKNSTRREAKLASMHKDNEKSDHQNQSNDNNQSKNWSMSKSSGDNFMRNRPGEEDELWVQQRRHQNSKEIDLAVQRAKQRREEEEKRFSESTKQGAAKKLQELEEKKMRREMEEAKQGTINPSAVPPKPVTPVSVPLPEFQRDRERDRDSRSRTSNEKPSSEGNDEKSASQTFRHLTQIEGKNLIRNNKHSKDRDPRDRDGSGGGSNFTKFDMPPRFLKQQQRNNNMHYSHQFDNRWMPNTQGANKPNSGVVPVDAKLSSENSEMIDAEDTRRDYKRQNSDDSYKSSYRSTSDIPHKVSESKNLDHRDDYRHQDYDVTNREKEEDKWQRERERTDKKLDQKSDHDEFPVRQGSSEWHSERRDKLRDDKLQDKFERPQRPDSRDSRASRDSRHSRDSARDSESREYLWSESTFESNYEEKKRDSKEDRRQVPGPITKDRIEADDIKNEKRKLTQLKRGQITDKKTLDVKRDEKILENSESDDKKPAESATESKPWTEMMSTNTTESESVKFTDEADKAKIVPSEVKLVDSDNKKSPESELKDRDDRRNTSGRNRSYLQGKKGWGGSNEYHRSGWSKRPPSMRDSRPSGPQRTQSNSGEIHGTDSEASAEDQMNSERRSPKPSKKSEKDEKNRDVKQDNKYSPPEKKNDKSEKRDNYVPRGEPSRHGRGGGNFRSRGSMSKRIDGYGPPPTKSPFGHPDDRDKKPPEETVPVETAPTEDKIKQSQQALSIGIIGGSRKEPAQPQTEKDKKFHENSRIKTRRPNENRRGKSRSKGDNKKDEDNWDTSDNSDENMKDKFKKNINKQGVSSSRGSSSMGLSRHNPPRMNNDKRTYVQPKNEENLSRQNSSGALRTQNSLKKEKPEENNLCNAIADISLKPKEETDVSEDCEEKTSLPGDSDGFQEVKSKKNVKEKQKPDEKVTKPPPKVEKEIKPERSKPKSITPSSQLTQQQISNIPSLMSTPVNPPQMLPPSTTKATFDRPRTKLAPRFAKQRENNRLQKVHMQQHQQQHGFGDVSELNKVNQTLNVYKMKDSAVTSISNAWDKPLSSQLRGNIEPENILGVAIDKNLEHRQSPNQSGSPSNDKVIPKTNQMQDTTLLDGSTPPVNTIIFENTNFKSTPVSCNARQEKPRPKMDEGGIDNNVMPGFNKPVVDLMNKNEKPGDSSMQLPISFKEDNMKLDFFDPDLSHLSDEKISKNMCLPRSMHAITSGNSTISTAESLNFKIASVKKVWETTPPDHTVVQEENSSFSATFVTDGNSLDPNAFNKGNDTPEDNHEGYSPSPNQTATNSTTNVCKVKPTQQVSGNSGQTVLSSSSHQQHSGMVGPGLMGHPLSPPPMQPVLGAGVGIGQPPQQFTASQHISYQAGLGGSTQYNMPAIPSPPTVLYNSTQQIQPQTAGLYGPFQIDQASVLGGQGRSQYSQYPNHYGLGQTASSPYSAQSVYLQTAQPHPPPAAQAPPDLYPNINNYRLSTTAPFGQSQQLNNPTTVLISSTSNSLMSASVKPSTQQMSAIGTKSGGVGQAYQQQSQGQQVYMAYDPAIQANYLPSAGVMQRAPTGPVQNNVVPALQPSSSYYSGSTGGQTGYFQQPASSTLQSAQLQQHQAGYGLQGNMFGTPSQSHTSAGLQSFNSHFSMQIAAAINAQQYRSSLPTPYIKSVGSQSISDQTGRPQQLKSPGSQEVLSSVFNSGSQIPSPKSRQNCKQPPPQPSPTGKHNYNLYQSVGNQQTGNVQRYPAPIQRPVSFQQNIGSSQQTSSQKHRAANTGSKAPSRQYYSNQTNPLSSQTDKSDEGKIVDSVNGSGISCNVNPSTVDKAAIGSSANSSENPSSDQTKEKETSALKE